MDTLSSNPVQIIENYLISHDSEVKSQTTELRMRFMEKATW